MHPRNARRPHLSLSAGFWRASARSALLGALFSEVQKSRDKGRAFPGKLMAVRVADELAGVMRRSRRRARQIETEFRFRRTRVARQAVKYDVHVCDTRTSAITLGAV